MSCETNATHAVHVATRNGVPASSARSAGVRGKIAAGLKTHQKKILVGAGLVGLAGGAYVGVRVGMPYIASRAGAWGLQAGKRMLARAMPSSRYAEQDRLFRQLERDLANVVDTADAAMQALSKRTSKWANAEFLRAQATKVRARQLLKSAATLRAQGGIALGPQGFQIN